MPNPLQPKLGLWEIDTKGRSEDLEGFPIQSVRPNTCHHGSRTVRPLFATRGSFTPPVRTIWC